MNATTIGASNADDAERACAELRTALDDAGVALSSLGLSRSRHQVSGATPLIDLGLCSPCTARRLAAVLRSRLPAPSEPVETRSTVRWPGVPATAPAEEEYDDLTPDELYAKARKLGEEVRYHLDWLRKR